MNQTKFEWDLAKTELKLQVWDELEGLIEELGSASDGWALYVPEDRPEEVSKASLQKLEKSELVKKCLLMQEVMNDNLDVVGELAGSAVEDIVEPIRDDLLSLQRKAEGILNRFFIKYIK